MPKQSYLERLYDKIKEYIDVEEKAVRKALELDDPRPFRAHKLSAKERLEYFASLPDQEKLAKWQQMDDAEKQEIGQGMMERMRGQGV